MDRRHFLLAVAGGLGVGSAIRAGTWEGVDGTPETGTPTGTPGTAATEFRHEVVDHEPPVQRRLSVIQTTDLTGNGRPDVIVGGNTDPYPGRSYVHEAVAADVPLVDRVESHLFWYENPGWERHPITFAPYLERGTLGDVDGDGRIDIVAGQNIDHHDLYWFAQPENPRDRWERVLITDAFTKYHDMKVGDVDDDGDPEVVVASQQSEVVFYYDIPADPRQSPWPEENRHIVAEGRKIQGLAIVDIDRDGRTELVAGPNVYHRPDDPDDQWRREPIATGWDLTKVAVADLDGDGEFEVVLSECDSPTYGTHPGRVAWFDPPDWEPTFLEKGLFNPHTLRIADFDGDGNPDIYVAELGLGKNPDPKHLLFFGDGTGGFEKRELPTNVPTHCAKVADIDGDGRPDIVGKPWAPRSKVDVWYNRL